MADVFLQELEGTVVMFDLRGFTALAAKLTPFDLGVLLGRFYEHAEECVLEQGGRVVKFMGDAVMAVWLVGDGEDHHAGAVGAIRAARAAAPAFHAKNRELGLPRLDYSVAAATGTVLAGQIGTERHRGFDVLGAPVNVAAKLTTVATLRGVDNLVTAETLDAAGGRLPGVEVEGIELGGRAIRLYRVE